MMHSVGYALLFLWVKAHALLPMRVLYVLSDVLCFIVYRVARYRLRVVRRNMKASFPDKAEKELRKLERDFYHHFADYIIETIKLAHISEKEIKRRAHVINPELLDQLTRESDGCIVGYMGHYGNWEWFTSSQLVFKNAILYQIYRPLKSRAVDRLYIYLRTRFGSKGIRKNDTVRDAITLHRAHVNGIVTFLSDQSPSRVNIHYWTMFLNQETPFYTGAERIAKKLDVPVVFLEVVKVKRGYYTLEVKLISRTPRETPEFWLTEQYVRLMEQSIMRNPAYWLWTHKRWKHRRMAE